MAHKTMVGGTAYSIVGGRSMVSGTTYDIVSGKTMVDGTTYNISFARDPLVIKYFNDYSMFFTRDNSMTITGLNLLKTWDFDENTNYGNVTPWLTFRSSIKYVHFLNRVSPVNMFAWFTNANRLITFDLNKFSTRKITNMCNTFLNCVNLTGSPFCGNNVTNMYCTYAFCSSLTGSPACGDNVIDMYEAYFRCSNLTGTPVCGKSVVNMYRTYEDCNMLTGSPACGDSVINMAMAYMGCKNITGSPACGNSVTNMLSAYQNCYNLTGCAVCGPNVIDMSTAYANCYNIAGNAYFYSSNVNTMHHCFNFGTNRTNLLNVYVPKNSATHTLAINNRSGWSITGSNITYTDAGTHLYNTTYKINIYPVENVAAARAANGD